MEVTVNNLPELITLADGTEHTLVMSAGINLNPYEHKKLKVEVISATTTVKFNNSGAATDSSATFAATDSFITRVNRQSQLRILGTTGDTIRITEA